MGNTRGDEVSGAVVALAGLGLMGVSARYPYWAVVTTGPGFFPLWLGAGLVLTGAGILVRRLLLARRSGAGAGAVEVAGAACSGGGKAGVAEPSEAEVPPSGSGRGFAVRNRSMLSVLGALVLYALLWERAGAVLTLFLFSFLTLKVFDRRGAYGGALVGAAVVTAVTYVLFRSLLAVPLPPGWLGL